MNILFFCFHLGFTNTNNTKEVNSVLDDIEEEGAADNSILDFDIKGILFS